MNKNNISKFVLAVALTLAVTFGTGIAGEHIGIAMAPSAQAACVGGGGGSGSGGGC